MKKTGKVIGWKYLPTRFPAGTIAVWWLVMDRFQAPSWAFGVFWTIAAMILIASVWLILEKEQCPPLFDEKKEIT